jgi:predicted transcriptional regulator
MTLQISLPAELLARVEDRAREAASTPEQLIEWLIQAEFRDPDEIERAIESNPQLKAMIEQSEADIREGRILTDEEVMEWEKAHPH